MGAEPWHVFTPYRESVQQALLEVQDREFNSGNYDPYGVLEEEGLEPTSMDDLREMMGDSGTGTVIDILRITDRPDYFAACPIPPNKLASQYGTDQPTRGMVEGNLDLFEDIDRGQGRYIIVYKDGEPDEIMFAGYSFD